MAIGSIFSGLKKLLGVGGSAAYPPLSAEARMTDVARPRPAAPPPVAPKPYPPLAQAARATVVSRQTPPVPPQPLQSPPNPATAVVRPQSAAAKGATLQGLKWFGVCSVQVKGAGIELQDPLTYFHYGRLPPSQSEPAAIDLALDVAARASSADDSPLQYWPQYGQLTPAQRRTYLDWLAAGRRSAPSQLGYTFLFIYGLERRSLLERQDVKLIFKEVLRLRQIYEQSGEPVSRSFENYTASFLWFLLLREPTVFAQRHFEFLARSMRTWDEDRLAAAVSWLARADQAMPDWLAFALAGQLPRSQRSVVVKRVGDELRDLFSKRFREQYPVGFALKASKRDRTFPYRPSSAALPPIEVRCPNPMGISSQFNTLSDLWNDCIADLKRLSSVVADSGAETVTIEAWKAMPPELRAGVDHPLTDHFAAFIRERTEDAPHTIVSARPLATLAGIAPDAKLTLAACRRMSETIGDVGYCIEPDPRLTGRSLDEDENVVLFLNLGDGDVDLKRYAAASTMLEVGLALAQADGDADEGELSMLTQQIDSAFELNEHEQRRLGMLRALRIAHPFSLADIAKPLKRLAQSEREQVAKFALALVAVDGLVTKDELKAVRRLYAAMGFDRYRADEALAALTAVSAEDEPVSVLPAVAGEQGEAIPPPPSAAHVGVKLNRAAIAAILKDTLEVSRMLADAMNVEEQPAEAPRAQAARSMVTPEAVATLATETTVDPDMPARYAAFYQVAITRPLWTRTELAALAKQHNLMLAGAVEAINDWSTTKHGGPLLYEDDQQFTLEAAYLN